MESATIKEIYPEQVHRKGFRHRNIRFEVKDEQQDRKRFIIAKVTGNAVDFAKKLVVEQEVVILYPGEANVFDKTCIFLKNESTYNEVDKKWFSELRCTKIYFNNLVKA